MLFETFTPFTTSISPTLTIHGIKSQSPATPNLPALLLLHGFPQTHHIWHKIVQPLSANFNIIALDLRGYGKSKFSSPISTSTSTSTPEDTNTTKPHKAFSKSTMATDCLTVMKSLGHNTFYICAHDRGARVAHSLLTSHPQHVNKAILLDIIPTLSTYNQVTKEFSEAYWHWFFLSQPTPFPENAILSNPGLFAEKFFRGSVYGGCSGDDGGGEGKEVGIFGEEVMRVYVEQLGDWETVHSMCEDYRAAATVDLEEAREDLEKGRKIQCPIRVLWGNRGIYVKMFDVMKEWMDVSDGEVSGEQVDSGHYIPEELPDVLVKHIKEFFV